MKTLRNVYARISQRYELLNHIFTLGLDIVSRRRLVRSIEGEPENILDLCTGTGETAVGIRKRFGTQLKITGFDFSLPMIRRMQQKSPDTFGAVCGYAHQLPFQSNSFDVVTVSFATRNLNTPPKMLPEVFAEIIRVLKPGGRFYNLETSQPVHPILLKLFHFYTDLVILTTGVVLSESASGYRYLADSMKRFYHASDLLKVMHRSGFKRLWFQQYFWGAVALHCGCKENTDAGI